MEYEHFSGFDNIDFIKKQIGATTETANSYITHMLRLSDYCKEQGGLNEQQKYVFTGIWHGCCKLFTQNMNLAYLFSEGMLSESAIGNNTETVNATEFVSGIVRQCQETFAAVGGELLFEIKGDANAKLPVKIRGKALQLAITNILQNAMLYSPLGSNVDIVVESFPDEDGQYFRFLVSNPIDENSIESQNRRSDYKRNSYLGIPLCMKIAEFYGGKFRCSENGERFTAELKLPLHAGEATLTLQSSQNDYFDTGRFDITEKFMQEVTNRLIGDLQNLDLK